MILIVAFAGPTAGVMEVAHDSAAASVPKKGGNVQFAAAAPANPVSTHAATSAVRTNATHFSDHTTHLQLRHTTHGQLWAIECMAASTASYKLFRTVPKLFEV